MKVQIDKGNLVQILQKVQSITEKKTHMPILANTLIKATEEQMVEFSVTDLELSLWTQLGSQVEVPGNTTVSARKLLEIIRELPQPQIVLEMLPNGKMLIQAGRSRFELSTIPPEDFPHMSFHPDAEFSSVDVGALKDALTKTHYSIPMDDDPFSVPGVYWHSVESNTYRFVSSDGHRLACYEASAEVFSSLPIGAGIVIPRKGVQEMLRVLEKVEQASLTLYENRLVLKTPDTLLSVQLLEAEFPDYRMIIPDERPFAFSVDGESFHAALKRVSVLTNQKWRHVRLTISNGLLELEAGNPEIGNANDAIDIDYEGEGFSVAFNIRYVMEAIQPLCGSQVRFEWVDSFHGGVFVGPEDPGYLGLIMPMVV